MEVKFYIIKFNRIRLNFAKITFAASKIRVCREEKRRAELATAKISRSYFCFGYVTSVAATSHLFYLKV